MGHDVTLAGKIPISRCQFLKVKCLDSFQFQRGKKGYRQVVLTVTRQLHFWYLVNEIPVTARGTVLNSVWWDGFHKTPHSERVTFCEKNGANASTIIFWIHLNMTYFGLYTTSFVVMRKTKRFDGALAMKEIAMALYVTATDTNKEAYKEDEETKRRIYKPHSEPTDSIAVCGLGASQVDKRNEFLLSYCEELLTVHKNVEGEEIYKIAAPCRKLTNELVFGIKGSNGRKIEIGGQPACFSKGGAEMETIPARRGEYKVICLPIISFVIVTTFNVFVLGSNLGPSVMMGELNFYE